MRILVTRPSPDAESFAAELRARGHDAFIEPMMTIEALPAQDASIDLAGVQALLFTSANGVRVFAARCEGRALPAFAVGQATGQAARAAGFEKVFVADGDVRALAALVRQQLQPEGGALLHPAARKLAGDLKGELEAGGFSVRRCVLYQTVAATHFSKNLCVALREGSIDGVSFFSPRTAEAFVRLAFAAGLSEAFISVRAFCLSRAVSDKVMYLPWCGVTVAEQPTQVSLLTALETIRRET